MSRRHVSNVVKVKGQEGSNLGPIEFELQLFESLITKPPDIDAVLPIDHVHTEGRNTHALIPFCADSETCYSYRDCAAMLSAVPRRRAWAHVHYQLPEFRGGCSIRVNILGRLASRAPRQIRLRRAI